MTLYAWYGIAESVSAMEAVSKSRRDGSRHGHNLPPTQMSANSGIAVSEALTAQFSSAIESKSVRFIKISIHNGSLHDVGT